MKVCDVMSKKVGMVNLDTSLVEAAAKMKSMDVGALPVTDGSKIKGMLTDRDIVVRAVAKGKDLERTVAHEVMTAKVRYVFDDDEIEAAASAMQREKVRRLVVLNREKKLVGVVSMGDLSTRGHDEHLAAEVTRSVSERAMH